MSDVQKNCSLQSADEEVNIPFSQPFSTEELIAWRSFLRGSAKLQDLINQDIGKTTGLTLSEYSILIMLNDSPTHKVRMSAIADYMSHSRSRLTHTIRRLEAEGYVERARCESDGRGIYCGITEKGIVKLEESYGETADIIRRHLMSNATLEEFTEFGCLFRKILGWNEADVSPDFAAQDYRCG